MTTDDVRADAPDESTARTWPSWTPWAAAATVAALVIGIGTWIVYATDTEPASMDGMSSTGAALPPPVTGYYEGEEVEFIHTETSDADVAGMLTEMMGGSPVIHTPALAKANPSTLATVYVFTNGIEPDSARGPFGYQPDVFDSVPGDSDYSGLRAVHLVEWKQGTQPRPLTSADEVSKAEASGDITITAPGIVVNMPITTWPDGTR